MKNDEMKAKVTQDCLFEVESNGIIYRLLNGEKKIAKQSYGSRGMRYAMVSAYSEGKQKHYYVHRLVAMSFVPNPDAKPQVNHIDGNTKNNCAVNLEWVTNQENIRHAYKTGLYKVVACSACGNETFSKLGLCSRCYSKAKSLKKSKDAKVLRLSKLRKKIINTDQTGLTVRQCMVLTYLNSGLSCAQTATRLNVSRQAVNSMINRIYK